MIWKQNLLKQINLKAVSKGLKRVNRCTLTLQQKQAEPSNVSKTLNNMWQCVSTIQ